MSVEVTTLKSGITVVTDTMPHLETASLGVWVASGSRDERLNEHGISHLLEHMAFKGTRRRSARQIAEEIEAVGGDLNAATSAETTAYYARVLKADVPLALDVLADILSDPTFNREELTREQSVIVQEIGAVADTPDDLIFEHLNAIIEPAQKDSIVWVDMEASNYVDATLDIYRRALTAHPNVGVCLQAYLYRTKDDLAKLLPLRPSIRLVKGAYMEPPEVAFPRKADVDGNYFALGKDLLRAKKEKSCVRVAFATHDVAIIRRLSERASQEGFSKADFEVQMLYGIQRAEQERLAAEGCTSVVLVAYGTFWYPWFVRRLAERPANLWFMVRNVFAS